MKSKPELRQVFRDALGEAMTTEELERATEALTQRLLEFLRNASGVWAAYQPAGFEPDIRAIFERTSNVTWAFPKVVGETLEFFVPRENAPHVLSLSRWGILEPDPAHSKPVATGELRGFLVPGVAFDTKCNRLGRGRGFYDRALAASQNARKIGVAFERQVSEETFPVETFDAPMDFLVTERRTLERAKGL